MLIVCLGIRRRGDDDVGILSMEEDGVLVFDLE